MRRSLAAASVAVVAAVAAVPILPAGAGPAAERGSGQEVRRITGEPAELTLSKAVLVLDPQARATVPDHPSEVLRELFESLPELEGEDRELAERILARPTDGAGDPRGHGYTVPSVKRCEKTVCLHWVRSTTDAPPNDAWAKKSLAVLAQVYRYEVGKLGYRRPVPDGRHGGNSKFDVYLKDLGTGLYGFCAPEYYKPGSNRVASGYCVIDNDFSRSQFDGNPLANLKVTLAHEFFHAVQFAYDFKDDPWIYESTAVWMEERFADKVDDNRQYLKIGQVRQPHVPLDTFADPGIHYGNWVWWEYLSKRFGNSIVRQVWSQLDANRDRPNMYSSQGMRTVLRSRGGLTKLFAAYAGGNTLPARTYSEGEHWPSAVISGDDVLGKSHRFAKFRTGVDHLASRNFVVKPDSTLRGSWKLRVKISGPNRSSAPAAYVIVRKKSGKLERHHVPLTRKGYGKLTVGFTSLRTTSVTITVANTSTSFTCRRGTTYSCRGVAKHDHRRFTVAASVVK